MEKLKAHKSLLPVILLALLCQWTLWIALKGTLQYGIETIGFWITTRQLVAMGLTAACLVSYFYIRNYYRLVLFITLLVGLLNVVSFTPGEMYIGMRVLFIVELSIHPLVAIVVFVTFAQMLRKKPHAAETPVLNAEALGDFIERYQSYDTERLQEIVREARYVPEALEAARQVLQERVTTQAENG